jgi:hypothetical protein
VAVVAPAGVAWLGQEVVLQVFLKTQAVTLVGVEVMLVGVDVLGALPAVVRLLHYGKTELGW